MDTTVYFKSADGVKAVKLPAHEATRAVSRWPHEWSRTADGFAEAPEGWVAGGGNGGGLGLRGTSIRDPRD